MKKNELIVGVVSAKNSAENFAKKNVHRAAIKRSVPTQYWQAMVKIWFDIYAELIPAPKGEEKAKPCFDTVESAQMKIILKELRKRAEDRNIEWSEKEAKKRWEAFLRKAFEDEWISKKFLLRIISTNKTLIFNNQITPKKNGTNSSRSSTESPNVTVKPKGGFGKLRSHIPNGG